MYENVLSVPGTRTPTFFAVESFAVLTYMCAIVLDAMSRRGPAVAVSNHVPGSNVIDIPRLTGVVPFQFTSATGFETAVTYDVYGVKVRVTVLPLLIFIIRSPSSPVPVPSDIHNLNSPSAGSDGSAESWFDMVKLPRTSRLDVYWSIHKLNIIISYYSMDDELRLTESPKRFWKQDYTAGFPLYPKALERDNYTCFYCGHRATDNWVSYIDLDASNATLDNMRTVCHCCETIMHCLKAGKHSLVILGFSKLSQVEIVKRSRAYYKSRYAREGRNGKPRNTDRAPLPMDIDPSFRQVNTTLAEFIALCESDPEFAKRSRYRGYFTQLYHDYQVE